MPTDPLRCPGALIVDDGRLFFRRRSRARCLLGGCRDVGVVAFAALRSIGS